MSNRPTILLTGYWPPTNEMLRGFAGGVSNWEGRCVDVFSHFPEFPPGCGPGTDAPWGVGDMEVDYRKTFEDFSRFVSTYQPTAIVTFSRCRPGSHWKLEPASKRFRLPGESEPADVPEYTSDRREPGFPFDLPPVVADAPGTMYQSSLPMSEIAIAVEQATAGLVRGVVPAIDGDYDFGGPYLSGFASYLGTRHATFDPRCRMVGHVHVGRDVSPADAVLATEATVRAVIEALDP